MSSTPKQPTIKPTRLIGTPIFKPKQASNKPQIGIRTLNGKLMMPAVKNNKPMIGGHRQPLKIGFCTCSCTAQ